MNDQTEVAIVAAMEREIAPLVSGWEVILGPRYRYYERGHVIVVAGGIGPDAAREAAETITTFRAPSVLMSVGLAGALVEELPVTRVIVPTKVLRADSNKGFTIDGRNGRDLTLVSSTAVADVNGKRDLAAKYGAVAVDMEAAAVAEVAENKGVRFVAVKAISDELNCALPPLGRFIGSDGEFRTVKFVLHAAIRPSTWPMVFQLKRNADRASDALCRVLESVRGAGEIDGLFRGVYAR